MLRVAIQGGVASFHDIAAREFFKDEIEIVECPSFEEVCDQLKSKKVDYGFLAIENTIAASILLNYKLIEQYGFHIVGEHQIRIIQNLIALPGQKIEDIKKVRSHYMAIRQCYEFLNKHPHIEVEEYHDTADAVKYLSENNVKGEAAIASNMASETYNAEVIAPSIETMKQNYTRFFAISNIKNTELNEEKNKATISFQLPDKVGSLSLALGVVVKYEINMTKIQSVPIPGKPDHYTFYLECSWNNQEHIIRCLVELRNIIPEFNILGQYKKFEH